MNLDEAVDLVAFAFEHAEPGDLFIQKADASTIGDLADGVMKLFGCRSEIVRKVWQPVRAVIPVRQISEPRIPAAVQPVPLNQRVRIVQEVRFRVVGQHDPQPLIVADRFDALGWYGALRGKLNAAVSGSGNSFHASAKVAFVLAVGPNRVALGADNHFLHAPYWLIH